MFYYLNGTVALIGQGFVALDVGGVGYKLTVSDNTLSSLSVGREAKLYTHLTVREDDVELFGFGDEAELNTFKLLINVSGIGPKNAISILSNFTPDEFAVAVISEDTKSISRSNGIGPKTAARIVLELKDKISRSPASRSVLPSGLGAQGKASGAQSKLSEATDALVVLGYSRSEALQILKDIDVSSMSIEDIIRASLKKVSRK